MAKNDNLKDFLTDVADAIREKKGTTDPINPQDFSAEIASISSRAEAKPLNDVNFFDYDGTILHSFTAEEFLALSAMPPLPTQEGLICQGWNYTVDKAKEYVTAHGMLDIGAMYITDDGNTRLYITIAAKGRMTVHLYFSQTVANGVTIDWGDGSETLTSSVTGNAKVNHTYADVGDYTISLNPSSGCTLGLGDGSLSNCVMGSTENNEKVYCNMLQAVEVGKNVTSIGIAALQNCCSLASIVIPQGVTSISNYEFKNCYGIASIVIPDSVASISTATFQNCYTLASVVIPQGVTSIGYYAFQNCYALASVVIPQGVTSIGNYAFQNCYGMAYYDFRASKSVPTIAGANVFDNIPSDCKIVVPDSLYSSWRTATNWSNYSSNIVKASAFYG